MILLFVVIFCSVGLLISIGLIILMVKQAKKDMSMEVKKRKMENFGRIEVIQEDKDGK